jgi:hypothetical protein
MSGGGGGPKFSFKNLNANAAEFVPSWLPADPAPVQAAPAAPTTQPDKVQEITKKVKDTQIQDNSKSAKKATPKRNSY